MNAQPLLQPVDDGRALRDAFGRFATGVTIIGAQHEGQPIGMTVNSFASVSLSPALVSWCIDNNSSRFDAFAKAKRFSINVLSAAQGDCCMRFAKNMAAFEEGEFDLAADGTPLLRDALAVFECELYATHEAGDHTIILGEVVNYRWSDGDALGFFGGKLTQIERSR